MVASKAAPFSEAHPEAAARWQGNVTVTELRTPDLFSVSARGSYWHRDKQEVDTRKTRALLDLGYRVVRIRENELPHLDLADPRRLQLSFSPAVGRPADLLAVVREWAADAFEP